MLYTATCVSARYSYNIFKAIMIAKIVYRLLALPSMLSSQGLLEKLPTVGVIWTSLDLILSSEFYPTSQADLKHLLHVWLVEPIGEFSKPVYLISANANGPEWVIPLISWYRPLKWLYVYRSYCDPFSGMSPKRELSTSIIIDENPVQGCSKELEPLLMRLQRYLMKISMMGFFFIKSSGASKRWKFDRSTAEVLSQVFVSMNDDAFVVEETRNRMSAPLNSTNS